MKKIMTDQEAIDLIKSLYNSEPTSEEEWEMIENILEEFQVGISNAMRSNKKLIPPEEVLRMAREKNKPIIL